MMMTPTELRPSSIHGLGVFLMRPVRRGELIWRFDSRIDRVYCDAELAGLPSHVQDYLRTYCTRHDATRLWVLCGDNGRYFNHSDTPSTISDGISFGCDYAARDLAAGDELTSDYRTICDEIRVNGVAFQSNGASRRTPLPAGQAEISITGSRSAPSGDERG